MNERVQISKELAEWLKRSKSRAAKVAVERHFSQSRPEPDTATPEAPIPDGDPGSGPED